MRKPGKGKAVKKTKKAARKPERKAPPKVEPAKRVTPKMKEAGFARVVVPPDYETQASANLAKYRLELEKESQAIYDQKKRAEVARLMMAHQMTLKGMHIVDTETMRVRA